jgi:hypothetical protein
VDAGTQRILRFFHDAKQIALALKIKLELDKPGCRRTHLGRFT